MNRIMIELVSELDSEWAATPMAYNRWRRPDETMDNGDPCFVSSAKDQGPRKDYIYMPRRKDLPAGYYHLLTQEAYVEVYYRLCRRAPPLLPILCKRRGHAHNVNRKEFKLLKRIIYNRVMAKEPNDLWAARMAQIQTTFVGARSAAFGKAMYLPTLATIILLSMAGH